MNRRVLADGVELVAPSVEANGAILSPEAVAFLAELHRTFAGGLRNLLKDRKSLLDELAPGGLVQFPSETASVRQADWTVGKIPDDLQDRRVEITGPVEAKMMINALNSGAKVFMADFEDANSPTWANNIQGQANLIKAVRKELTFVSADGKSYELAPQTATLMVRPRGLHLPEKHFTVDGSAIPGCLFDFGLYFFHNANELLQRGSGPYFYLPKLESYKEARWWNEVFTFAQKRLGIPHGSIKVTVLIETIFGALQMDEILFELKDHITALNAGRWDYIFSAIKKFRDKPGFVLPDRGQVSMTVPFMRAYTERLVQVCHRRGAHAMGGMSAFIPSRRDAEVNANALKKVREDKARESGDGFDGTWVAHPDLVPVAKEMFDQVLGASPHQKHRLREEVNVTAGQLTDFYIPGGTVTEEGVRSNIVVALLYLDSWLAGNGAVAIFNLMEDAATAEISRSQLWQWVHRRAYLDSGQTMTPQVFRLLLSEESQRARELLGKGTSEVRLVRAVELLAQLVLSEEFADFLTLPAYEYLD